mmetsp:Transcript_3223/g.10042  ORF Transcript_3223/g.10042 Transcript_3223/m.10042 type:complete len:296 (+) Transcript_3223:681-1568(+)
MLHVGVDCASIPIIGDTPAIRCFRHEVSNGCEWHASGLRRFRHVSHVKRNDVVADLKVTRSEIVDNVVAEGPELATFQENRMEVAQREKQRSVQVWPIPGIVVEVLFGDAVVQALHVGLDARGRFGGHLDGALQNADRECRGRRRAQPQSEVFVRLHHREAVDDLFKLLKPRNHQMAVGEEHPASRLHVIVDKHRRNFVLTLTQRQAAQRAPFLLRECNELRCRIHTWRQHENEGENVSRFVEGIKQAERRGVDVASVKHLFNEMLHHEGNTIRTHTANDDHTLQVVVSDFGLPL